MASFNVDKGQKLLESKIKDKIDDTLLLISILFIIGLIAQIPIIKWAFQI